MVKTHLFVLDIKGYVALQEGVVVKRVKRWVNELVINVLHIKSCTALV